jgi:hypothetical protein
MDQSQARIKRFRTKSEPVIGTCFLRYSVGGEHSLSGLTFLPPVEDEEDDDRDDVDEGFNVLGFRVLGFRV